MKIVVNIFVNRSAGEFDWVLPIACALAGEFETNIVCRGRTPLAMVLERLSFLDSPPFAGNARRPQFGIDRARRGMLDRMLPKLAPVPARWRWYRAGTSRRWRERGKRAVCQVLLCDETAMIDAQNDPLLRHHLARLTDSAVIVYPHSNAFQLRKAPMTVDGSWLAEACPGVRVSKLQNTTIDRFTIVVGEPAPTFPVGIPSFGTWWKEYLAPSGPADQSLLVLCKQGGGLPVGEYVKLMRDLAQAAVESAPDHRLGFRLHPRDDRPVFERQIVGDLGRPWTYENGALTLLATRTSAVLTPPGQAAFDFILAATPVIFHTAGLKPLEDRMTQFFGPLHVQNRLLVTRTRAELGQRLRQLQEQPAVAASQAQVAREEAKKMYPVREDLPEFIKELVKREAGAGAANRS